GAGAPGSCGGRPRERSGWPTGSGGIGSAQGAQRPSTARAPGSYGGRPRERSRQPTGSGGIGSAQGAQRPSTGRAPGSRMSYYAEKDFFDDPALLELVQQVLSGNLTLAWYGVENTRVRARPADPVRGLTYQDGNLGPYGYDAIPDVLRDPSTMPP